MFQFSMGLPVQSEAILSRARVVSQLSYLIKYTKYKALVFKLQNVLRDLPSLSCSDLNLG